MMEEELIAALAPLGLAVTWGAFDAAPPLPRVTLMRVSTRADHSLRERADLETARVQVTVQAESYAAVIALTQAVATALEDLRGGSVIRCREIGRRDAMSESGGEVIRLQMLDVLVRYRA